MVWKQHLRCLSINNVRSDRDLAERDDRGGEVVQSKETVGTLFVPDEELAGAVKPAMGHFDDPAPRAFAGMLPQRTCFVATPLQVRNIAMELDRQQGRNATITVAAHKCLWRRCGGAGRCTCTASRTASSWVTSCRLAPVTMSESGTPRPSTNRCRLLPFFSPIRGIWPDRGLRHGCFQHRSVDTLPAPGDPFQVVVLGQANAP